MKRQSWILVFLLIAAGLLVFSPTRASSDQVVQFEISGDFPIAGYIQVDFFHSLENLRLGFPIHAVRMPVTNQIMSMVVPDIPDGNYIIRVFHDINGDGIMNSNAFGVPTEASLYYNPLATPGTIVRPHDALFDLNQGQRVMHIELPAPGVESRAWGTGVMMILSSNPYRGGDSVIRALPLITFVGEHFYIIGPRAGFNLHKSRFFSANLTAEFKFAGDAFKEEKFLSGMENRRDTIMAGFDMSLRGFGRWRMEYNFLTDVLERHDGQESTISLGRNFRGDGWSITPGIGAVWRSSNYNDYYYGVRRGEVTDDRPAYNPGSSVEIFGRIFGRFEWNDSWSLIGSIKTEVLSDAVKDSPIVDKKLLTSAFLGLNYAF